MRCLTIPLTVVILFLLQPLVAQETIPRFRAVANGIELRQVTLMRSPPLTLTQVRCDPKRVDFNLLTAPDLAGQPKKSTAAEMARAFNQDLVINSSYFDTADQILGYTERLGNTLNPDVATGSVFGAFFYYDGARAGFKERGEALPKDVPVLFQAGPRLVWDGQPITGLEASHYSNRTILTQDRQGRITVVVIGGLYRATLAELPELLMRSVDRGGVDAVRALNLDGGSSTQLSLKTEKSRLQLPGRATVPAFLGIKAR